jgi:hypothetical protein
MLPIGMRILPRGQVVIISRRWNGAVDAAPAREVLIEDYRLLSFTRRPAFTMK